MSTAGDFTLRTPLTPKDGRCPFSPIVEKYILRFRSGLFLRDYSSEGIFAVSDIQQSKLFSVPPIAAADILRGEILTVLTDGRSVRRTLLQRLGDGSVSGCSRAASGATIAPGENHEEDQERTEGQESEERKHQASGYSKASNGERRYTSANCVEKSELATETKAVVGAESADSDGQTPRSFLITRPVNGDRVQLETGKRVFFDFISTFLGIEIIGLQNGFGVIPDQFLFSNEYGSTLMLPVNIMLQPREIAISIVQAKLESSAEKFRKAQAATV